jgi:hypothetical protein
VDRQLWLPPFPEIPDTAKAINRGRFLVTGYGGSYFPTPATNTGTGSAVTGYLYVPGTSATGTNTCTWTNDIRTVSGWEGPTV